MRFMLLLKASVDSEAGVTPSTESMVEMGKYNEELVKAGVLLDAAGLHPSVSGARVDFTGSTRTVTDGPFTDAKELIAGFWMIQVKSKDEAIEWAKRCPHPLAGAEARIELRRVVEPADFPNAPDALAAQELARREALHSK
jgi:hypothetical protein